MQCVHIQVMVFSNAHTDTHISPNGCLSLLNGVVPYCVYTCKECTLIKPHMLSTYFCCCQITV